ncbi:hypothetical protein BJX61DRAFT_547778 [Aspergillus egyptiacus]|nr:hypothetical protein BJX61DRAFT_547778 [Aspergillus egyptiacus]
MSSPEFNRRSRFKKMHTMTLLRRLLQARRASAAPPKQHGLIFAEHENLLRKLEKSTLVSALPQINHHLTLQIQESKRQHLADTEKIHRLQQLLSQAHDEASRLEQLHHEEVTALYATLHAAQTTPHKVPDEELLVQMRRLNQHLEHWVRTSFRDPARFAAVVRNRTRTSDDDDDDGFPRSMHQRHAWIQTCAAALVYDFIFAPYLFGIPGGDCACFARGVERGVREYCSESAFQTWKFATSLSIQHIATGNHEASFAEIINTVEEHFGAGSSTLDEAVRKRRLRGFLEACAAFKNLLSRQPETVRFDWSMPGETFSEDSMTFGGGDGVEGGNNDRDWKVKGPAEA